jgi:hypothetical protein
MSAEEENGVAAIVLAKVVLITSSLNVGAYLVSNYDKVTGALLSVASTIYVCIKIYKEVSPWVYANWPFKKKDL